MSSPGQVIWLDSSQIIIEGYLTKSPPLDVETLIRKRWRLRWFVLCYDNVEPTLYYFKNEKYRKQCKPKGKISLVDVDVLKQRSKVNGYPFVINVQTERRLYHLCSTQQEVHQEWLEKLKDHHVPSNECRHLSPTSSPCKTPLGARPSASSDYVISTTKWNNGSAEGLDHGTKTLNGTRKCRSNTACPSLSSPSTPTKKPLGARPSALSDYIITVTNRNIGSSERLNRSVETKCRCNGKGMEKTNLHPSLERHKTVTEYDTNWFYSSDTSQVPYQRQRAETDYDSSQTISYEGSKWYAPQYIDYGEKLDIDTNSGIVDEAALENVVWKTEEEDKISEFSYVIMDDGGDNTRKECDENETTNGTVSEDEGIGRSDSESSGTTSTTTTTTTKSALSQKLFEDAMRVSRDDSNLFNDTLMGRGFVGPRISVTKKKDLTRTRSVGDLLDH